MPQLDISTYASQIFWLFVCFGILCIFLSGWITPRIGLSLHQRNLILKDHTQKAKKLLEEIQELREQNLLQLTKARQEAKQQLHEVIHQLTHHRHETIREFDRKLHMELSSLSQKLYQQKQEILDNPQELIRHLVETLYQKITHLPANSQDVEKSLSVAFQGDKK